MRKACVMMVLRNREGALKLVIGMSVWITRGVCLLGDEGVYCVPRCNEDLVN